MISLINSDVQVLVPGSEKRVLLESLQPDTRYSVMVTAEYRSREGGSASAQGKTCECSTYKHFLMVSI